MENFFSVILGWILIGFGVASTALLVYSCLWCIRQKYVAGAVRYAVMAIFSTLIVTLWILSSLK